ncbi:MAG: hypothetical protein ACI9VS_001949 [Candidatus Binatia bacterium]
MRKQRIAATASIAAVIVLGWLVTRTGSDEPTYEGKTVTEWIDAMRDGGGHEAVYSDDLAFKALMNMGSNAVPTLLRLRKSWQDQSRWDRWRESMNENPRFDGRITSVNERAFRASAILGSLGTNAVIAIPSLLGDAQTSGRGLDSSSAQLLGEIGSRPDIVIPALIESLSSTNRRVRYHCMIALGKFGPAAEPALPHLRPFLQSTNPIAAIHAAGSICQIDPENSDAERAMLLRALKQTGLASARVATIRLADLGPAGVWALPTLEKYLNDTQLGGFVENAINYIDPDRLQEIESNRLFQAAHPTNSAAPGDH